jgi:hypothetical protein
MQRKWEKRTACSFWTMRLIVPNSPIIYNLSNFITGYRSLSDKIIEVLLYHNMIMNIFPRVTFYLLLSHTCTFQLALSFLQKFHFTIYKLLLQSFLETFKHFSASNHMQQTAQTLWILQIWSV